MRSGGLAIVLLLAACGGENAAGTSTPAPRPGPPDRPPIGPQLVSPLPGAVVRQELVQLAWQAAIDPEGGALRYHVWARPARAEGTALFVDEVTTGTEVVAQFPPGAFAWSVTALDEGSNTSDAETRTFIVDPHTLGPPVLRRFPEDIATEARPRFALDAVDPRAVEVAVRLAPIGGAETELTFDPRVATEVRPEADLPDGPYRALAVARDGSGNEERGGGITFRVDTTLPAAPVRIEPEEGAILAGASVDFGWEASGDPGGAPVRYRLVIQDAPEDGCPAALAQRAEPPMEETTAQRTLPDGAYCWTVHAVDEAGWATDAGSSWRLVVDQTAPARPELALQGAIGSPVELGVQLVSRSAGLTFLVSGIDRGVSRLRVVYGDSPALAEGAELTREIAPGTSGQVELDTGEAIFADGLYYALAFALDPARNQSAPSALFTFRVDATPPYPPQPIAPRGVEEGTSSVRFSWTTTSDPGSGGVRYRLRLEPDDPLPGWRSPGALLATPSATVILADGHYRWRPVAVDAAGLESAGEEAQFTVDTTPPPRPTIMPLPFNLSATSAPLLTVTGISPDVVELVVHVHADGVADTSLTIPVERPAPPTLVVQLSDLRDGVRYFVDVTVKDTPGNASPPSQPAELNVRLSPPAAPSEVRLRFNAGGGLPEDTLFFPAASDQVAYLNDVRPTLSITAATDRLFWDFVVTAVSSGGESLLIFATTNRVPLALTNGEWRIGAAVRDVAGRISENRFARIAVAGGRLTETFNVYRGPPQRSFEGEVVGPVDISGDLRCPLGARALGIFWGFSYADSPWPTPLRGIRLERTDQEPRYLESDRTGWSECVTEASVRWRFMVVDVAGNESQAVERSFTADDVPPAAADALSPLGGWFSGKVPFAWTASAGATGYLLALWTESDPGRWSCETTSAGARFCTPSSPACAKSPSACRATWRCPALDRTLGERVFCQAFGSDGVELEPALRQPYCPLHPEEGYPGAGCQGLKSEREAGWACTWGETVSCRYLRPVTDPAYPGGPPPNSMVLDLPSVGAAPEDASAYGWNVLAHDASGNFSGEGRAGAFTVDQMAFAPPSPWMEERYLCRDRPGLYCTNDLTPAFLWQNTAWPFFATHQLLLYLEQAGVWHLMSEQTVPEKAAGEEVVSYNSTTELPEGRWNVQVRITDAAGNESAATDPLGLVVDRTPPARPFPLGAERVVSAYTSDGEKVTYAQISSAGCPVQFRAPGSGEVVQFRADIRCLAWTAEESASAYAVRVLSVDTGRDCGPSRALDEPIPVGSTGQLAVSALSGEGVARQAWVPSVESPCVGTSGGEGYAALYPGRYCFRVTAVEQLNGDQVNLSPPSECQLFTVVEEP